MNARCCRRLLDSLVCNLLSLNVLLVRKETLLSLILYFITCFFSCDAFMFTVFELYLLANKSTDQEKNNKSTEIKYSNRQDETGVFIYKKNQRKNHEFDYSFIERNLKIQ